MALIAKIFKNGRSQAVRLPAAFRFNCKQVYIHKDSQTGDIILSRRPGSWEEYFKLTDKVMAAKDFMDDRKDLPPQDRELF